MEKPMPSASPLASNLILPRGVSTMFVRRASMIFWESVLPGAFYDNAYSATVALLEAIKAAGSTDSQKIMEALRTNMVDTSVGPVA